MKIKTGGYVKVKPSTCQAQGLKPEHPYRVAHFHDVPPLPVRMKNGVWFPPHPIIIEVSTDVKKSLHVEDCAPVDLEAWTSKPQRHPVDRVAVLQRLRRDFCLKEGRYPTVDQEARQKAREEAKSLRFTDKMEPWELLKLVEMKVVGRLHLLSQGWSKDLADEWALYKEWDDLLKAKETQVAKAMGLTADMVMTLNRSESPESVSMKTLKERDKAKRAEFRLRFGNFGR